MPLPELGVRLLGGRTVSEVAAELDCDWHTVNDAVTTYGQALHRGIGGRHVESTKRDAFLPRRRLCIVAALVEMPEARRAAGRTLTEAEAKCLLMAARGDRLEALVLTGLFLGLRPGELLGLCWSDVDLKKRRLTVARSLKRQGRILRLGEPKTAKSVRTVDIPPTVLIALRALRAAQGKEWNAGSAWADLGLVFTTEIGTPIDPSNLRRSFAKLTLKAGLGHWHPHELRHSTASLL